ncbi:solute carrier family 20 (sodium-dependent phosphate transporter) [Strigomonas culicis]|uniref:Phosphate transporter n=2 Tax=Strigomonas culicis TaxID=28005 RepID=S9U5H2_9TRYP|nr:solute carrier family 20 (sodium-dependent phosphate transporter) [Strigomonas culicis]|eukprot:EPY24188.1 solute carrier family 20 (sodium-dependent phosphate transporter) [Strigomonas culicis]
MANPFLWIVTVGGFLAFLTGAGVGMNDLSNAFGTTYGAKVLTLVQICILASICEFAGSVSLGGAVTSTISGGIANPSNFTNHPYFFMYGMLCACGAAFTWLAIATWLTLPVSSTHSICGGIIGFALVFGGGNGVYWAKPQSDFPFFGGVAPIVASWFISPLLTGIVAALIYGSVRFFVLRPKNSVQRAIYTLPLIVGIAFFLESFFVLYKGAKTRLHWDVKRSAWVAACIGGAAGGLSCGFIPLLKLRIRRIEREAEELAREEHLPLGLVELEMAVTGEFHEVHDPHLEHFANPESIFADIGAEAHHRTHAEAVEEPPRKRGQSPTAGAVVSEEMEERSSCSGSERAAATPTARSGANTASGLDVQMYNSNAEIVYRYLQIFTAICASFAHGASDVSNAVGPFAAIYAIYQTGEVEFGDTPIWILCLGGAGLVVGLSTFGVRLMRLLGEKITVITPSRGFSAELSAALVVSFASGYGIPVSSTHCITGAVVAISMVDVGIKKVRWLMVLKMYGGWIFTLVVTAVMSATFFAQGVYAPGFQ